MIKKIILVGVLLLSISVVANEEPDFEKENRFYKIFKTYNEQPVAEDAWQTLLQRQESKDYNIQTGDTLWDISTTYFGDGYFWPKLWSVNRSIGNPHTITIGNTLRFIPGTLQMAPSAQILSNSTPEGATLVATTEIPQGAVKPQVELPPPLKKYNPVLQNFPESLPTLEILSASNQEYDEAGVSVEPVERKPLNQKVILHTYLSDGEPTYEGSVVETERNGLIADDVQNIFVKTTRSDLSGRFTIVKAIGNIEDPDRDLDSDDYPAIMEVQAQCEILEQVNAKKKYFIYKAKILKLIVPVTVGASLVQDELKEVDFSNRGNYASMQARVIGGEFGNNRKLFGPQATLFINKGSEQGVNENDLLTVHAQQITRNPETIARYSSQVIGVIKVVKASRNYSTCIVISTTDAIHTGDIVGPTGKDMLGAENLETSSPSSSLPEESSSVPLEEVSPSDNFEEELDESNTDLGEEEDSEELDQELEE